MKKLKWRNLMMLLLLSLLIIPIVLFLLYVQFIKQAPIEYQQYNTDRLTKIIEQQLTSIDRNAIRKKGKYILNQDIKSIQESIDQGKLTYSELTAFYLDRIQQIDQSKHGINAFVEINKNAMAIAKERDLKKRPQNQLVYGMPITLKDNINTSDMPTSGGTYALRNFTPSEDADIVKQFKNEGAIVLGKVNLSELANFMSMKMPDGYSSKGGQTQNPHQKLELSPSGSSSGSAASITANIGVISIGTETLGSIISPANIQSVVGFKPSINTVSQKGIIPLSPSLDTAGPITRNLNDAIIAYDVITSKKKHDKKETSQLANNQQVTLGIPDHLDKKIKHKLIYLLKKANIKYKEVSIDTSDIHSDKIMDLEFKTSFEKYATDYHLPIKTLNQLILYNKEDKEKRMKYGQYYLEKANEQEQIDTPFIKKQIHIAQSRLQKLKNEHQIDGILSIGDEDIVLSAVAGYPELSIPFGKNDENHPIGMTLIGVEPTDYKILEIGKMLEQVSNNRVIPEIYSSKSKTF